MLDLDVESESEHTWEKRGIGGYYPRQFFGLKLIELKKRESGLNLDVESEGGLKEGESWLKLDVESESGLKLDVESKSGLKKS